VARVTETENEIIGLIGGTREEILKVSAKTGEGVPELLEAIAQRIPPPKGDSAEPLQALIFDSHYDPYRGTVCYVRVMNGEVKDGDTIRMMNTGRRFEVSGCGYFRPELQETGCLSAGDVGYVFAGIKDIGDARVGDTITLNQRPAEKPVPGFRRLKPLVFCGFYAADNEDYDDLKAALARLSLNDSALYFEQESSEALGFGFRCGFLGLLHMEIVQERLEREYQLDIVATAPSVAFEVELRDEGALTVDNPARIPPPDEIECIKEPYVLGTILTPVQYQSALIELCKERRGELKDIQYFTSERANIYFYLPLSEILYEFYDALKTQSRGLASFDYELVGYRESDLVRVDILINKEPADALAFMAHRKRAQQRGREVVEILRRTIPRHLFAVPVQAAIGSNIIARETIPALRKDVIAKCYGGDITRKRKLLERQRKGKQRMRSIGSVSIPQEAFLAVLKKSRK
jgi:GTP-binding protein LepA